MHTTTTPQQAVRAQGADPGGDSRLRVVVLALSGVIVSLSQTLVVPLIATLPEIVDAPAADASWVITITLLVAAVATPVAGRLGDLVGKKRMMLILFAPLVLGSLLCATSTGLAMMVAGRGLQGLSLGLVPLGISLMRDILPARRIGPAVALMSSSMGVGGALGIPAAAAVAQFAGWRWLFWGLCAIALVAGVLVWRLLPEGRVAAAYSGRFDVVGVVGLAVGLVAFLLPVSKGADWGWSSPAVLALFTLSAVTLSAWGWWELRAPAPLVDLRVSAHAPVLLTNLASILVGFAMYAQTLAIPQVMQLPASTGYGLGQTMLQMGLWMAPQGVAMMAVSSLGARMSARWGAKVTLAVGSLILAGCYGFAILFLSSLWGLLAATVIGGAGVGLAYGAMPALIMGNVPVEQTGAANGINALMRSVGTAISAAVIGVILAALSMPMGAYTVPTEAGFQVALLAGGVGAVLAAVVALFVRDGAARPGVRQSSPKGE